MIYAHLWLKTATSLDVIIRALVHHSSDICLVAPPSLTVFELGLSEIQ